MEKLYVFEVKTTIMGYGFGESEEEAKRTFKQRLVEASYYSDYLTFSYKDIATIIKEDKEGE